MLYFEQVDSFSHLFMKYAPPKPPVGRRAGLRALPATSCAEWYRYQDELLGPCARQDRPRDDGGVRALRPWFQVASLAASAAKRWSTSRRPISTTKRTTSFIAAGPHVRRGAELSGSVGARPHADGAATTCGLSRSPRTWTARCWRSVFWSPPSWNSHPIRYLSSYEDTRRALLVRRRDRRPRERTPSEAENGSARRWDTSAGAPRGRQPGRHRRRRTGRSRRPGILARAAQQHGPHPPAQRRPGQGQDGVPEGPRADPNNSEALLNIGAIHQSEGRSDLAQHFVQRALQVDPNSIGALSQLAEIRRDQGQLDEAIRLFGEALRIDDSQPGLFMGIGDVLQRAGRFDEAVKAFESVLSSSRTRSRRATTWG